MLDTIAIKLRGPKAPATIELPTSLALDLLTHVTAVENNSQTLASLFTDMQAAAREKGEPLCSKCFGETLQSLGEAILASAEFGGKLREIVEAAFENANKAPAETGDTKGPGLGLSGDAMARADISAPNAKNEDAAEYRRLVLDASTLNLNTPRGGAEFTRIWLAAQAIERNAPPAAIAAMRMMREARGVYLHAEMEAIEEARREIAGKVLRDGGARKRGLDERAAHIREEADAIGLTLIAGPFRSGLAA